MPPDVIVFPRELRSKVVELLHAVEISEHVLIAPIDAAHSNIRI